MDYIYHSVSDKGNTKLFELLMKQNSEVYDLTIIYMVFKQRNRRGCILCRQ